MTFLFEKCKDLKVGSLLKFQGRNRKWTKTNNPVGHCISTELSLVTKFQK